MMKIEFLSKIKVHIFILLSCCGINGLAQNTEYNFNLNDFS